MDVSILEKKELLDTMDRRTRGFPTKIGEFRYSDTSGKNWTVVPPTTVDLGAQITESEGHGNSRDKLGRYHEGGPFYTTRVKRSFPTIRFEKEAFNGRRIVAPIGTPLFFNDLPTADRISNPEKFRSKDTSDLDPFGATAISIVAPTNPNAELGVALAEMHREGVPTIPGIKLWQNRTKAYLGVASEFLNATFGWLPLVSDILDTSQSIRDGRTILDTYRKGAGSNVHREFSFPVEESETTVQELTRAPSVIPTGTTGFPEPFQSLYLGPGTIVQTRKVESRKWFSGAFTYAVPDRSDAWSEAVRAGTEADKLFGITITPDLLWELTPWSWAVDWFTNVGHVMNNVSSFTQAGLVMRYGYMMEENKTTITHRFKSQKVQGFDYASIPASTYEARSKVRRGANPFGFGITYDGLSPIQVAIAGAVGITKLF
jgi:hypothetical protein